MQIDEVMAGCAGDSAILFIEMRLGDFSQGQWGPNALFGETVGRARLVFSDAAGLQTAELVFAHDAPIGAETNPSVLIATAAFAAIPGAPAPDFIVPANVVAPDGQVCFTSNPASPAAFPVNLCLSYGAFTGAVQIDTHGNPNGVPAPALPTSDASSLKRTRNLDAFEVHSNADFTIGTPAPKNAAGATVHLATMGGACAVAPSPCEAAPRPGCQAPAVARKSLLVMKGGATAEKNQLLWKWLNGSATSKDDFDHPTTTTDYALCIYDATSSLVGGAAIPAGGLCGGKPCWKEQPTGFEYKDNELTPDGIAQLKLKAGASGKAKIQAKGKGASFPLPAIPLAQPVRVQLQAPNGTACWEAIYSAPATQNTSSGTVRIFKDKAD